MTLSRFRLPRELPVVLFPVSELHCEESLSSKAFVSCGSSRFELPLIPLDDYPMLPKLPAGTGSINAKLFTEAVSQVASPSHSALPTNTSATPTLRNSLSSATPSLIRSLNKRPLLP